MTDLVFHRAEKYIEEDIEYYFSGERDIHSQVKPGQDIYSFTPDSKHLDIDFNDGKIGNLFFPFSPGSLDRIYIGISFPLFANSWGAAFLSHLMSLVKPDGCVVLPVYPEMQASEKNYWARSFLENIFISRSRWKGMSNIWAENDGVMSMRVGRKAPPEIDSTANYLFKQGSQAALRHLFKQADDQGSANDAFLTLNQEHWQHMGHSAIIEVIIRDHFGRKGTVSFCALGHDSNNTLLATELLLSPYINVKQAANQLSSDSHAVDEPQAIQSYYRRQLDGRLLTHTDKKQTLNALSSPNVISLVNALDPLKEAEREVLVKGAWEKLNTGGVLIVHQTSSEQASTTPKSISALLEGLGDVKYYSSIAGSEHKPEVEISHYSLLIEEELRKENETKEGIFWVIQK